MTMAPSSVQKIERIMIETSGDHFFPLAKNWGDDRLFHEIFYMDW